MAAVSCSCHHTAVLGVAQRGAAGGRGKCERGGAQWKSSITPQRPAQDTNTKSLLTPHTQPGFLCCLFKLLSYLVCAQTVASHPPTHLPSSYSHPLFSITSSLQGNKTINCFPLSVPLTKPGFEGRGNTSLLPQGHKDE